MNRDDDKTRTHVVLTKGTMVSHYRIVEKIGAGGMGEVYLAEDTELDRKVALKFLPSHLCLDEDCRARFKREAQAVAMLNHPNIITIHEVSEYQGRPFFAMELVEGQSLRDLAKGKEPTIDRIIELTIQICDGLGAAHDKKVVHRDIKPSNIVIDAYGRPKILDFGLAAIQGGEHLTKTGSTLGTVRYMSPEQVEGKTVDHRSDLFSLGVVLYEMITGRTPFEKDNEAATLKAITQTNPEPLARYKAEIPDELQRTVSKLLEKDPSFRYQSAAGVMSDLKPLVTQTKGSMTVAPSKLKNRWPLAVGGLVITAILIATGIEYWPGNKTEQPIGPTDKPLMLVVLPFENLGQEEDLYFADGMTDEITSRLASVKGLGIISRTSAMHYRNSDKTLKDIGRELGADYVLEGTVRWSKSATGQRVRITSQLIRVDDDRHIWADNYERKLTDVFEVQSDIATNIVEALGVTLLEPERARLRPAALTRSMAAYDSYLRGNDYLNRGWDEKNARSGIEILEKAVELDPDFAVAYARLSSVYSRLVWSFGLRADQEKAAAALKKAFDLDPNLPEAHLARGVYLTTSTGDYDAAREEFETAREGLGNSSELYRQIALLDKREGLWERSLSNTRKALDLDPKSVIKHQELLNMYLVLRDYPEADRLVDSALTLLSNTEEIYFWKIITSLLWKGNIEIARDIVAEAGEKADVLKAMWNGRTSGTKMLGLWRFGLLDNDLEKLSGRFASNFDASKKHVYYVSLAEIHRYQGQTDSAMIYFDSARTFLEGRLKEPLNNMDNHMELGLICAFLGSIDDAKRFGIRAKKLVSIDDCHW